MAKMTDEQKYSALLKDLGELLASKDATISWQDYTIADLKKKLAEAEKQLAHERELNATLLANAEQAQEGGAA